MMITTAQDIINNPEQLDKLRAFVKECDKLLENPKQRWTVKPYDYGLVPNSWYKYAQIDNPGIMYLINAFYPDFHVSYMNDSDLVPIGDNDIVPLPPFGKTRSGRRFREKNF